MLNLLGRAEGADGWRTAQSVIQKALNVPGATVHWYEKANVQKNRKVDRIEVHCSFSKAFVFAEVDRTRQSRGRDSRRNAATPEST